MRKENMLVTPEIAKAFLDRNANIRTLNRARVALYAKDMIAGTWRSDHPDPLMFDSSKKLRNGQHRLHAIIETGVPISLPVWHDCPEELIAAMDGGLSRNINVRVQLFTSRDQNRIAVSLVDFLKRFHLSEVQSRIKLTPDEVKACFREAQPEIEYIVPKALRFSRKGFAQIAVLGALCEFLKRDPSKAKVFIDSYLSLDNAVSQAVSLRTKILTTKGEAQSVGNQTLYSFTVQACKYFTIGKDIKMFMPKHTWQTPI